MNKTTNERLEALLPKLRNICSGYRINADDAAWLEGLLHTSASLPEPGVVSEPVAWMTPAAIAHLAKQNGVAKVDAWNCASGSERVGVYLTPPTAPVAAPAGEDGPFLCDGCGKDIASHDPMMRCPQPAPAAQGGIDRIAQLREAIEDVPETLGAQCNGRAYSVRDNLNCVADLIAATAQHPAAVDGAMEVPHQECYSNDDGDTWLDSPYDAEFIDGLALGDEFELTVSHYSIRRTYRVTKVPGEDSDDYEIEPVAALRSGSQEGQDNG